MASSFSAPPRTLLPSINDDLTNHTSPPHFDEPPTAKPDPHSRSASVEHGGVATPKPSVSPGLSLEIEEREKDSTSSNHVRTHSHPMQLRFYISDLRPMFYSFSWVYYGSFIKSSKSRMSVIRSTLTHSTKFSTSTKMEHKTFQGGWLGNISVRLGRRLSTWTRHCAFPSKVNFPFDAHGHSWRL
jgi:hypothetical protein